MSVICSNDSPITRGADRRSSAASLLSIEPAVETIRREKEQAPPQVPRPTRGQRGSTGSSRRQLESLLSREPRPPNSNLRASHTCDAVLGVEPSIVAMELWADLSAHAARWALPPRIRRDCGDPPQMRRRASTVEPATRSPPNASRACCLHIAEPRSWIPRHE